VTSLPTAPAARGPYSTVIRERWRRPRFRGDVPGANAVAEDVNPLCGDRVRMQARVDDGRLTAVGFTGDSCAICAASADVLAELATGRSVAEATAIDSGDVLDVLDAEIRPTRMRCLTLPISVLRAALGSGGGPA
jgi:nitrogen fixation protein NifU and related proteins